MASTVLPNGIIIPEKYSRDWYNDLYHNWQELDNLLGASGPGDGTLTIQKNGATVGTFSANQATDETINITVPDVNNGTLTIQQNGATVDTFTANSSADKTVNITVPTKTSDLTNDSGFITSDTTKIPLAGSNQISGDLIPSTDGTVNLGGSSYQWNNLYAKNYYYNGTAWGLDKANVWTAHQKIVGSNSRGAVSIYSQAYTKGSALSSTDLSVGSIFMGDGGQTGLANSLSFISTDLASNGAMTQLSLSAIENTASSALRTNVVLQYDKNDAENPRKVIIQGSIFPHANATYPLGTSTIKWKSFNGINPGALSLPNVTDNAIAVDTTNFTWNVEWTYTPVFDGWLVVLVPASSATKRRYALKQGLMSYWYSNQNGEIFRFSMPVVKDVSVGFGFISDIVEPAAPTIYLLKSQGNV